MWARIENGLVAEITDIDPAGRFHHSLTWVGGAGGVGPGWRYLNGVFEPVELVEVPDLASAERAWRDAELAGIVWLRDRHRDQLELSVDTSLTAEQFTELLTYMQALRDWPQSEAFPDSAQRPVAPPWIANQVL